MKKYHEPTVMINESNDIVILSSDIKRSLDYKKPNKIISILPEETEEIVSLSTKKHMFNELQHMNLILTNACNLSCTYCYEQHNKDFGRFTSDTLLQSYNWLKNINNQKRKIFQFFGGEPLIHKKLIMEFLTEHDSILDNGWDKNRGIIISMCTNGLLLTDEFINFYFSKSYTNMLISIDTLDISQDHRQISQSQQTSIINNIKKITSLLEDKKRLIIRCTLSEESVIGMTKFLNSMYEYGIRNFIVHPLVLDSSRGFIEWKNDNWNKLTDDIFTFLDNHQDCLVKFSEGVGKKQDNNCMIGSDMIAIDASGDYSGCYFFTNHKSDIAKTTILGNIFKDKLYLDRYKTFKQSYNDLFEDPQCISCDYQNYCYQCPAGNLDTGSSMFRPDNMCQKIVKLYLDFKKDVFKKTFLARVNRLIKLCEEKGVDEILSPHVAQLTDIHFNQEKNKEYYLTNVFPDYRIILGNWNKNIDNESINIMDQNYDKIDPKEFIVMRYPDKTYPDNNDLYATCFYIELLSTIKNEQ